MMLRYKAAVAAESRVEPLPAAAPPPAPASAPPTADGSLSGALAAAVRAVMGWLMGGDRAGSVDDDDGGAVRAGDADGDRGKTQ